MEWHAPKKVHPLRKEEGKPHLFVLDVETNRETYANRDGGLKVASTCNKMVAVEVLDRPDRRGSVTVSRPVAQIPEMSSCQERRRGKDVHNCIQFPQFPCALMRGMVSLKSSQSKELQPMMRYQPPANDP